MYLQSDGQPFLKQFRAIAAVRPKIGIAVRPKIGIKKPFTIGDARKSVETYAKLLDPILQKTVAPFPCYSK